MSINMPAYYHGDVTAIKFTSGSISGSDVTKLILDNTIVWAKPFNLSITLDDGVSEVIVHRTVRTDPSAPTADITRNASCVVPVFYGETIIVTPRAKANYTLQGTWPQTLNIVENASVTVSTTTTATKLLPVEITGGGTGEIKEERSYRIYTNVKNPNNIAVDVHKRLFNIKSARTEIQYANTTDRIAANSTGTVDFTDYSSTIGFSQWADPNRGSKESNNGALIAMFCSDTTYNNTSYIPSIYKFWSNKWDMSVVNNSNNKIVKPVVSAVYYNGDVQADGSVSAFVTISSSAEWPFGRRIIVEAPSGPFEPTSSQFNITVPSLSSIIKVHFEDSTDFGFEPSDTVEFKFTEAESVSSES